MEDRTGGGGGGGGQGGEGGGGGGGGGGGRRLPRGWITRLEGPGPSSFCTFKFVEPIPSKKFPKTRESPPGV